MSTKPIIPVSVVLVTYNVKDYTRKALAALYNSSVLPKQVILVDNASHDGVVDMVRAEFPEVLIIESKENLGFAKANNRAIRELATEPYVWLLNADTETGVKSMEQIYNYLENNPKVGAVSPQLVYPTGDLQSVGGYFPSFTNVLFYLLPFTYFFPVSWRKKLKTLSSYPQPIGPDGLDLEYVTGAASLLRREALDQVGLLGEEYFMYFEETDLCWRLHRGGWRTVAIDCEPVMHVYGGSYKTKYDPKRLNIFLTSLKIFVNKNYSFWKRWPILLETALLGGLSKWLKSLKK